mmetsp:Transcript_32575/g.86613  ORF Transcript_32575/g.86613 Transcript_32575/m.86613 type:complete len:84 (-) Transcript_32575:21-272(-)
MPLAGRAPRVKHTTRTGARVRCALTASHRDVVFYYSLSRITSYPIPFFVRSAAHWALGELRVKHATRTGATSPASPRVALSTS